MYRISSWEPAFPRTRNKTQISGVLTPLAYPACNLICLFSCFSGSGTRRKSDTFSLQSRRLIESMLIFLQYLNTHYYLWLICIN